MSFQATPDQFDAVFGRWMLNANFPRLGAGQDALVVERGLFSVERWGFFFVPPDSEVPIGVVMLKMAPETRKTKTGRVAAARRSSTRLAISRAAIWGLHLPDHHPDGVPVGEPFTINSHGHALSDETDVGDYTQAELPRQPPQPQMDSAPPQDFTLTSAQEVLRVENRLPSGAGPYGG